MRKIRISTIIEVLMFDTIILIENKPFPHYTVHMDSVGADTVQHLLYISYRLF
jgi:hypothetical protein